MLRKGLILGIIVLFIGASVVPNITGFNEDVKEDYIEIDNSIILGRNYLKNKVY